MNFSLPLVPHQSARGAVVVFVLLLMLLLGMLTAGWLTLIGARSGMVEAQQASLQRRIALENSKALAQQFMLERVMLSDQGNAFTYDYPVAGWGGISVPLWQNSALKSFEKAAGVNHFNPGNGNGYTLTPLSITLHNGAENPQRRYHVKSRAPAFAGSLLSSHRPTLSPSAPLGLSGFNVDGHSMIWMPTLSMSAKTSSYTLGPNSGFYSFETPSGHTIAPSNMARPRMLSNPREHDASVFRGELDVINNAHPAANSLVAKALSDGTVVNALTESYGNGITSDGSGSVSINVATKGLGNIYIPGNVRHLTLVGQTQSLDAQADDLPAMLIVVDQTASSFRDLSSVTLNRHNHRRVVLAVKKNHSSSALPIIANNLFPNWRLLLELENTPIVFENTGRFILRGGIRSDRSISINGSAVSLRLESDPKYLERLASRHAWIESLAP